MLNERVLSGVGEVGRGGGGKGDHGYFIISYYVKELGAVIVGFCCLFYNKILLNLT